jgi:uncharacterized protein (DUF1499 family)
VHDVVAVFEADTLGGLFELLVDDLDQEARQLAQRKVAATARAILCDSIGLLRPGVLVAFTTGRFDRLVELLLTQHDHARIAPLQFDGDGMAAMTRLAEVLRARERTRIVVERPDYLRVELQSRWLRFVDDAEFWLDPSTGVIQVRSASRLGAGDLGTNRANIEDIRDRFTRP